MTQTTSRCEPPWSLRAPPLQQLGEVLMPCGASNYESKLNFKYRVTLQTVRRLAE